MRFIDDKSLERLGFKKLINKVEPLSPYGNERLKKLKSYTRGEEDKLNNEFNKMEKFIEFSHSQRDLIRNVEIAIHNMINIKKIFISKLKRLNK